MGAYIRGAWQFHLGGALAAMLAAGLLFTLNVQEFESPIYGKSGQVLVKDLHVRGFPFPMAKEIRVAKYPGESGPLWRSDWRWYTAELVMNIVVGLAAMVAALIAVEILTTVADHFPSSKNPKHEVRNPK